jgi:hypothetical protein
MTRRLLICIVFILLVFHAKPVDAQGSEIVMKPEFVWGGSAFDDQEYSSLFSPSEVPQLFLLAGQQHVLTGRNTLVYYWPIDHTYKADWETRNELVEGKLQILDKNHRVLHEISYEPYLMTNDDFTSYGNAHIAWGSQAEELYAKYVQERDAYLAAGAEYSGQMQEYLRQRALDPSNANLKLPNSPEPFEVMFPEPSTGFPILLQPGEYLFRMLDSAGQVIPTSERTVVAVEPRQRAVGYDVIPEDRWVMPEASDNVSEVIYFSPNATNIYLRPMEMEEFNEQAYLRIREPQDKSGVSDRWKWVHKQPLDGAILQIWSGSRLVADEYIQPFKVHQTPGNALGYEVLPLEKGSTSSPDFNAYQISTSPGVSTYTIRLIDSNGIPIPGTERTLVRALDRVPLISYILVLMPLVLGGLIQLRKRHNSKRSMKELASAME